MRQGPGSLATKFGVFPAGERYGGYVVDAIRVREILNGNGELGYIEIRRRPVGDVDRDE